MKAGLISIVIGAALIASCAATPSITASGVKEADLKMIESCQFVGTVFGNSMLGVAVASTSASNAVVDAKEKAAALGATHIVIETMKSADLNGGSQATVRAYKCEVGK